MPSLLVALGRAAFGSATAAISSVFQRVTSFAATLFGSLLSRIVGFFASLPGRILDALSSVGRTVISLFGGALKGALYAVAGAIGSIVALSTKAVQSTLSFGRAVGYLSASTGLNSRSAGATQQRFGAFGIDASETFAGRDPALFGMRAGAYGVPGFDSPNFLPSAAGRFQNLNQGGVTGRMLAQQLAETLGLNNAQGLRTLNTPVGDIRAQQGFTSRVSGALGLNSDTIVNVARQWDLLTGRLRTFGEGVLVKIGQSILPRLNQGLEVLASLAEKSAGGLSGFIDRAINGAFDALLRFANFLYKVLPDAALSFSAVFLKGLLAISSVAPTIFDGLLKAIDVVQSVAPPLWSWLQEAIPSAFTFLVNGVNGITDAAQVLINRVPEIGKAIQDALGGIAKNPVVAALLQQAGIDPSAAGTGGTPQSSSFLDTVNGYLPYLGLGGLAIAGNTALGAYTAGAGAVGASGAAGGVAGGLAGISALVSGLGPTILGGLITAIGATGAAGLAGGVALGGAVGNTAGYLGYKGAQAVGLLDRDTGYVERLSNGFARVRNVLSGNSYDANVTDGTGYSREAQAAAAREAASGPVGLTRNIFEEAAQAYQTGFGRNARAAQASAQLGLPSTNINPLANLLNGIPQGSISRGLDGMLGGAVRGGGSSEAIQRALAMIEDAQKGTAGRGNLEDLMKQLLGETQRQTQVLQGQSDAKQDKANWDQLARTVGRQLSGKAKMDFMRLVATPD